jgi:hypothetical protein
LISAGSGSNQAGSWRTQDVSVGPVPDLQKYGRGDAQEDVGRFDDEIENQVIAKETIIDREPTRDRSDNSTDGSD